MGVKKCHASCFVISMDRNYQISRQNGVYDTERGEVKFHIISFHQVRLFGSSDGKKRRFLVTEFKKISENLVKAGDRQGEYYDRAKKNQLDEQLILSIFRQPQHVSGVSRSIIRRCKHMYTTIGTYYSFLITVALVGLFQYNQNRQEFHMLPYLPTFYHNNTLLYCI
jgi:hypothetical protein